MTSPIFCKHANENPSKCYCTPECWCRELDHMCAKKPLSQVSDTDEDGPCYYCGELTKSLSGHPGEWPIGLCHSDDPGRVKPHHTTCIDVRLLYLEGLNKIIPSLLQAIKDYCKVHSLCDDHGHSPDCREKRSLNFFILKLKNEKEMYELRTARKSNSNL